MQSEKATTYGNNHVEMFNLHVISLIRQNDGNTEEGCVGSFRATLVNLDPEMNRWEDQNSPEGTDEIDLIHKLLHRNHIPLDGNTSVLRPAVFLTDLALEDSFQGTGVEQQAVMTALRLFADRADMALFMLPTGVSGSVARSNKAALRFAQMGFRPLRLGSRYLWLDLDRPDLRPASAR